MDEDIIEGDWKTLKIEIQKRWAKLTKDHMDSIDGSRDKLSKNIQKSYALAKDLTDKQIADWERNRKDGK